MTPNSGGNPIGVDSFIDWKNGGFDELKRFGHIPTAAEREKLDKRKQVRLLVNPIHSGNDKVE